jgi:hypothetical protein
MALHRAPIALGVLAAAVLTGGAAYAVMATGHSTPLAPDTAATLSDFTAGSTTTVYLEADLNGQGEQVKSGKSTMGDPNATAIEVLRIRGNQVAYALSWRGLGTPTVAHVRQGTAGHTGAVAITQLTTALPRSVTAVGGSLTVHNAALLARFANNPAQFYVNLGTNTYPQGAIRGQFHKVGPIDLNAILHVGSLASLDSGDQEIPLHGSGTGDPNTHATAFLGLGTTTISYALTWSGTNSPTGATLNKGAIGANGTNAATLFTAPKGLPASVTALAGTVTGVSRRTISAVKANPAAFHTNLLTTKFPTGAARGQLFMTTPTTPTTNPTMPPTTKPTMPTTPPMTTMPTQPTTTKTSPPTMPTSGTTTPTIKTPAPPHW